MPQLQRSLVGPGIVAILTLTGCVGRGTSPPAPSRSRPPAAATNEASPSLEYARNIPPGWRIVDGPEIFAAANLSRYLDGDAAWFRAFGVIDLLTMACADGSDSATVEIFRFPDATHAFGAFSARRSREDKAVTGLGDGAYRGRFSLHVWKGADYLRITGPTSPSNETSELAASIVAAMPSNGGLPEELALLATGGRISNSESFDPHDGFGQPYFADSFSASFSEGRSTFEGMVVHASGRETATEDFDSYRTLYGVNGKLLDPIPGLGEECFSAEDSLLGRTVALRRGEWIVAYRGFVPLAVLAAAARESDEAIERRMAEAATPVEAPSTETR